MSPLSIEVHATDEAISCVDSSTVALSSIQFWRLDRELVGLLLGAACRWRDISLTLHIMSNDTPLLQLLNIPPQSLQMLSALNLEAMFIEEPEQTNHNNGAGVNFSGRPVPAIGILQTPQLRRLSIPALGWCDISSPAVKWSALTHLTFLGYCDHRQMFKMTAKQAIQLLARCSSLVSCKLELDGGSKGNVDASNQRQTLVVSQPIVLAVLARLKLIAVAIPVGFASAIIAPSLRSLILRLRRGARRDPRGQGNAGIVEMMCCFGSQLLAAQIPYASMTTSSLMSCLETLERVRELTLVGQAGDLRTGESTTQVLTSQIMKRLTPNTRLTTTSLELKDARHCLCPKLESLHCMLLRNEFQEEDLIAFVAARRVRRPGVARIDHVRVEFVGATSTDVRAALSRRMVHMEGLMLDVT